jgi:transcriptional antiterminator RfaH
MYRVNDNPIPRFPDNRTLEADLGNWFVARVKSRQEKALAFDLIDRAIPYYFPMIEKRSRRRDNGKIRKSLLPLFPGYIAMALHMENLNLVYSTNRVVGILPVIDQQRFVDELAQIQHAMACKAKISLMPAYTMGQSVLVKTGPMKGLRGEVIRSKGQDILIIKVAMFKHAVRVEMDEADLEAL